MSILRVIVYCGKNFIAVISIIENPRILRRQLPIQRGGDSDGRMDGLGLVSIRPPHTYIHNIAAIKNRYETVQVVHQAVHLHILKERHNSQTYATTGIRINSNHVDH